MGFITKEKNREYYLDKRHGGFRERVVSCLYSRKKYAKRSGIVFEVEPEMFEEMSHCRLLPSMEFCYTNNIISDNSLSIDRIDPTKGYTKDNTWVICQKANRIKNDATFEEFEQIYLNWKAALEERKKSDDGGE